MSEKEQEQEKKPVKKKKKFAPVLFGLLFLVGFGILAYPTISNQWNTYRQSQLISNYESSVNNMTPEDYTDEWLNMTIWELLLKHLSFTVWQFFTTEQEMT